MRAVEDVESSHSEMLKTLMVYLEKVDYSDQIKQLVKINNGTLEAFENLRSQQERMIDLLKSFTETKMEQKLIDLEKCMNTFEEIVANKLDTIDHSLKDIRHFIRKSEEEEEEEEPNWDFWDLNYVPIVFSYK